MSIVNYPLREIGCKIVYCGPGLCGKTTNVEYLHAHTVAAARGAMVTLKTEAERTLFFDFFPLDVGKIRGFRVRLQIYTVPGQFMYEATRRLILRGADGIVFVADSQEARIDANLIAMEELRGYLADQGMSLEGTPLVVQYNKRDLPAVLPLPDLRAALNPGGVPDFSASARSGEGVFETLKTIARVTLADLARRSA